MLGKVTAEFAKKRVKDCNYVSPLNTETPNMRGNEEGKKKCQRLNQT
jgi:hypothetical protein